MKSELASKEASDLQPITAEKTHISSAAESTAPNDLMQRVQTVESRWEELKSKVENKGKQFAEGLSNWNVFQGTQEKAFQPLNFQKPKILIPLSKSVYLQIPEITFRFRIPFFTKFNFLLHLLASPSSPENWLAEWLMQREQNF